LLPLIEEIIVTDLIQLRIAPYLIDIYSQTEVIPHSFSIFFVSGSVKKNMKTNMV